MGRKRKNHGVGPYIYLGGGREGAPGPCTESRMAKRQSSLKSAEILSWEWSPIRLWESMSFRPAPITCGFRLGFSRLGLAWSPNNTPGRSKPFAFPHQSTDGWEIRKSINIELQYGVCTYILRVHIILVS